MSATKVVAGVRSGFGRGCSRYLRRLRMPSIKSPTVSARSAFSTATNSRCTSQGYLHDIARPRIFQNKPSTASAICRRAFTQTSPTQHGHLDPPKPGEEVYVTFIDKEGDEHKLAVNVGDSLLTIAQAHDIDMEGACEGSCSCSTCHVIVEDEEMYDKLEEASDDENDMLDLAFGLTETSRLGCQITMTKELDGLRVRLPSMTRNLQASDFASKK